MKCEACLSEMIAAPINPLSEQIAIKHTCPNECMTIIQTSLWTATEYHKEVDADGYFTLYESGARE